MSGDKFIITLVTAFVCICFVIMAHGKQHNQPNFNLMMWTTLTQILIWCFAMYR